MMSPLSRSMMDAYYLAAQSVLQLSGFDRRRVLRAAGALGALRSWVGYVGPRKSRAVFLAHMARALPGVPATKLPQLLGSFWFYHQLRFLDLFTVDRLSPERLGMLIRYEGLDHLDRARSGGRGAVVVTLHLGDARVAHVALGLKGYPVHLLSARYGDYGTRARNARLRSSRRYHAVHFLDEPLGWMHQVLADNGLVFLAISGYGGSRGHPAPFLNAEIVFSSAPARLALSTGAPVIPLLDLVDGSGIHHITVRPPPAPPDRPATMVAFTHGLVRLFEEAAQGHPAQLDWIWYVIRCQEHRGEVAAYEEGKVLRSARRGG